MGNCVSLQFQFSLDQTVNHVVRFLFGKGYTRNLKENLRDLEREMEVLKAIQHDVQNKVEREERLHRRRLKTVQVWLKRVESLDTKVNNLLSISPTQIQKLCLCGLCSKNVHASSKYGKSVFLSLEEVKELIAKNFEVVAESPLRSEVEERPVGPTIGQEDMVEKAWNRIMEDGVRIMGLHGMGGVGKTTLFNKIHNKFSEIAGSFGHVIWVMVSQGAKITKIQEDIAKKLHICDEGWKNKDEFDKAAAIYRVLKEQRFVLMLDDIWKKVELEALGVPFPTKENGCKVVFTTRSREVCGLMGDHEPIQVDCLEENEAWELFKSKVGDNTLARDPVIAELARKVAEKCDGLPLALTVIGETMSSKSTVQEWEHAINVLNRSAAEFSVMENKILPILKYSYDSLEDEDIKSCFLYCALLPEYYRIHREWSIRYWICEGFIQEHQDIKRAMNKGYDILGTLIRSNLLTDHGTEKCFVVMHDVVRDMALWIASSFGKQKENFVVEAGVGLHEIPNVKDWGAVSRMSLMDSKIEEITCGPKCCELKTLFLQNNDNLKSLSGEFIRSMEKLLVLDLSNNSSIDQLPEEISELASLRSLDLSSTSIKHLPVGFHKLKNLIYLNLMGTKSLCSISGISELSSLRILKLIASNVHGDVSLVKELQLMEHLQVLHITISTMLALELILGDQRLANCIYGLEIQDFYQEALNISELLVNMENLSELTIERSHVSEMNCCERETTPRFTNLSAVIMNYCSGFKDLTWLLFAPNLVYLHIESSEEVEEIINKEKATNLRGISTPFQDLEVLWLQNLPKLESIYWSALPFSCLIEITSQGCPKLRKLPLNATSVTRLGDFFIGVKPREETDFEWEDEDTKNRFLPLITEWPGSESPS